MSTTPTPEDFRAAGFTADAINYPRTEAGFLWLCKFNGCPPEKAPRAWRYASSKGMLEQVERLAREATQ